MAEIFRDKFEDNPEVNPEVALLPSVAEGRSVEVQKFNGQEPALAGHVFVDSFLQKMIEKYPDREYSRIEEDPAVGRSIVSYVARDTNGEIIGLINGKKISKKQFKVFWFMTDPEFQSSQPAEKLWDKVFSDFDKVKLYAKSFGIEKNATEKDRAVRQKALVRYYKKLGFEQDFGQDAYLSANGAMSMIWKKNKNMSGEKNDNGK